MNVSPYQFLFLEFLVSTFKTTHHPSLFEHNDSDSAQHVNHFRLRW